MNRLVLLGNGFDLAHRMPTTYYDFLFNYLRGCFQKTGFKFPYEDKLIKVVANDFYAADRLGEVESVKDYLKSWKKPSKISISSVYDPYTEADSNHFYDLTSKSDFISRLFQNCNNCNWVDIEMEYYESLKQILEIENSNKKMQEIKLLNESMEFLIETLSTYLSTIELKKENLSYVTLLRQAPTTFDYVDLFTSEELVLEDTLILNFNYTPTIEHYTKKYNIPAKINYIHGKLGDYFNPLILGFGDEKDSAYQKIESEKAKGFFRYIKSFGYFRTTNYPDLIRFIESNKFEVYVWGHSCGLSDRTMLNMIFEHQNCKSIKIFYHEKEIENNYRDLTEEISRHFTNKSEMRRKIVSLTQCSPMPQAEKDII